MNGGCEGLQVGLGRVRNSMRVCLRGLNGRFVLSESLTAFDPELPSSPHSDGMRAPFLGAIYVRSPRALDQHWIVSVSVRNRSIEASISSRLMETLSALIPSGISWSA